MDNNIVCRDSATVCRRHYGAVNIDLSSVFRLFTFTFVTGPLDAVLSGKVGGRSLKPKADDTLLFCPEIVVGIDADFGCL